MPTYDYSCEECNYVLNDIVQSFKDEPLKICPACGKDGLSRILYGGIGVFVKDVKTIGQLADKNYKDMGSYKRSELDHKKRMESSHTESPFSKFGKASAKQINKMSESQKQKYIITGET